ncbi:MAG: nucleoside deaminase [Methylomicrobium sp.]
MQCAIELARLAPQYPFGAVIIRRQDGECVGQGFNRSDLNPTFHGEMVAINDCASRHRSADWSGFDLYTTAEPCAMCQGAIEWAGIGRVFYGTSIPYLQMLGWRQIDLRAADISARTAFRDTVIIGGILEAECNTLFVEVSKGCFDGDSG